MSHIERDHLLRGLKGLRIHRRRTHRQMAEVIGLCTASYSQLENGKRRPYYDQVLALAKDLGVPTEELTIYRDETELWHKYGPRTPEGSPYIANYKDRKAYEFNKRLEDISQGEQQPEAPPPPLALELPQELKDLDDSFVVE